MNPEILAKHIRDALAVHGYEIRLREWAPRTEIGLRRQIEFSEELANQLLRRVSVGEAA